MFRRFRCSDVQMFRRFRRLGEGEEALDVGDDDGGAAIAEVGADPVGFSLTGSDKNLCAAEAKALDGSNKSFLPTVISAADWIIATFRNPMYILAPKRRPPKAGLP